MHLFLVFYGHPPIAVPLFTPSALQHWICKIVNFLLVFDSVTFVRETSLTKPALVWLFSGMSVHMPLEMILLHETSTASVAHEKPLLSMSPLMSLEIAGIVELFTAEFAIQHILPSMQHFMSLKR